jgi:tetratricopeptide (TPR) repeat protein
MIRGGAWCAVFLAGLPLLGASADTAARGGGDTERPPARAIAPRGLTLAKPPPEPSRIERNSEAILLRKVADLAIRQGAHAAAIPLLRRAAKLVPTFAPVHTSLGMALLRQGTALAEAEAVLRVATKLDPRNAWAHYQLALAIEQQGRAADALPSYREATRIDPSLAEVHEAHGRSALAAKRDPEARAAFEGALRADRRSTIALTNLADLYERAGEHEKTEQALRRLIEISPSDWVGWERLAAFYGRRGRIVDEARTMNEVRRLNPQRMVLEKKYRPLAPAGAPK